MRGANDAFVNYEERKKEEKKEKGSFAGGTKGATRGSLSVVNRHYVPT